MPRLWENSNDVSSVGTRECGHDCAGGRARCCPECSAKTIEGRHANDDALSRHGARRDGEGPQVCRLHEEAPRHVEGQLACGTYADHTTSAPEPVARGVASVVARRSTAPVETKVERGTPREME